MKLQNALLNPNNQELLVSAQFGNEDTKPWGGIANSADAQPNLMRSARQIGTNINISFVGNDVSKAFNDNEEQPYASSFEPPFGTMEQ